MDVFQNAPHSEETGPFPIRNAKQRFMRRKILITAWNAYPAINPSAGEAVGGLETFAWSFARHLARSPDLDVVFCVRTACKPTSHFVEQVQLFSVQEPLRAIRHSVSREIRVSSTFPWLRVERLNPHLLWKIPLLAWCRLASRRAPWAERMRGFLKSIQPDIVLSLGVNADSAAAACACRSEQIPIILWIRSNADLNLRFFDDENFQDQYRVTAAEARASVQQANLIIVQSDWQQQAVKKLIDTPVAVIRNPVDTARYDPGKQTWELREGVLWIGRYDRFHKRPLLALEIAELCPEIPFRMIVNAGDEEVRREVERRKPDNVTIVQYIPNSRMPGEFQRAKLFLSTGSREFEGFPNVLLEAVASGTPICSLEDFDQFLERSNSGFCSSGDIEKAAEQLRTLYMSPQKWEQTSRAGVDYVGTHHSLPNVIQQFLDLLNSCCLSPMPAE